MASKEICVVGIKVPNGSMVKTFDVCIKGEDVYNYSDSGVATAHGSYHASGQQHTKIGRKYVDWTGEPTGDMEPTKIFREPTGMVSGRNDFWTIGWEVSKLGTILPPLDNADMVVDARALRGDIILGLKVSVVASGTKDKASIVGYPVIASHRFGKSLCAEVLAFTVTG